MTILTARVGENKDLFPDILAMYVPDNSFVADVTYGRGAFWQEVPEGKYRLLTTDLKMGVDFRNLPYEDSTIDCVVLDPPYMHGDANIKKSINDCYGNANSGHESVQRLYAGGILEAARVLRQKGVLIVKCQDEIESGRQHFSHIEIYNLLIVYGFRILDLFVLVQNSTPTMREQYQKSARKNHSYFWVAEFRR